MKEYISILAACPLFAELEEQQLLRFFSQIGARETKYLKGSFLLHAGDSLKHLGILLSGSAQICQQDYDGNNTLLAQILPGDFFGEAFACTGQPASVSVLCVQPSTVLWLNYEKMLTETQADSQVQRNIIVNLLRFLSQNNIFLTNRIGHLSKRTLRKKLLSYLSEQSQLQGSHTFTIHLNRQELADYLAADRSAVSAVLSKLQEEGILTYHKNQFTLL